MKNKYKNILSHIFTISLLFIINSCDNLLSGEDLLTELNVAIKNANSNEAVVRIECIPEKKNQIIPPVGPLVSGRKKQGAIIDLSFEESDAYIFDKWVAVPEGSIKFDDEKQRNTRATIISSVSDITIEPICIKRNVLKVNFSGDHGTTNPYEQKSYFSKQSFPLTYRSEASYCFTKWDVLDFNNSSMKNPPVKIVGSGSDVTVEVLDLESDMEITIKAVSVSRPKVSMNYPKMTEEGVKGDTAIQVYFSKEMDDSNIGDYIRIVDSKTGNDLKDNFKQPKLNKTDLIIEVKNNLVSGTEVLVIISGDLRDKDGIQLGYDYTWTYKIE